MSKNKESNKRNTFPVSAVKNPMDLYRRADRADADKSTQNVKYF